MWCVLMGVIHSKKDIQDRHHLPSCHQRNKFSMSDTYRLTFITQTLNDVMVASHVYMFESVRFVMGCDVQIILFVSRY